MSSVWKHPKSRYWTACYTDHTGKQRKRSTKTTDRRLAEKIAYELEQGYRKHITEAQVRKIFFDVYEELHGKTLSVESVEKYLQSWLRKKEIEIKAASVSSCRTGVKEFLKFMGEHGKKDISLLTSTDIFAFRDAIARRLASKTANRHLKTLKNAFNDAWIEERIRENPAARVQTIKRLDSKEIRRPFTVEELQKILERADDEWKGIILTAIYTGQRLGDIVRMTWENVDLTNEMIFFTTQKTGRRIILPIAKPFLDYLLGGIVPDDISLPLFPRSFRIVQKQGKVGTLSNQFYEIMVASRLAEPREKGKTGRGHSTKRRQSPISFHSLRHTATSLLKNAGVSEAVAMDIIGHSSKAISRVYTHIDDAAKRKALDSLPDITKD